jgi:DME family drug/metabolite transporter
LVLLAAVLWGTTGTAQAFAPTGAQPEVIGAARIAVGGAALLAFALARGSLLHTWGRWPPLATGVAALGVAAYQLLFFTGVSRTGVAVGTIVAIGSAPVLSGLIGFVARGERPGGRWASATVLAVAGCVLLVGSSGGQISVDALGVGLSLGAGASYAIYATASKHLLERLPSDAVMAVLFALGALLLSPLLAFGDLGWLGEPKGIAVALHLGIAATAAAYLLFGRGLSLIPVAAAATLSLAEPLTAGILGVVVLGEHLTVAALIGSGLVLGGLVLLSAPGVRSGRLAEGSDRELGRKRT